MRVAQRVGLSSRLTQAMTAAVGAALLVSLASCALSSSSDGAAGTASNTRVITLNNIDTLKSVFNREDGHTRLILIFSPT